MSGWMMASLGQYLACLVPIPAGAVQGFIELFCLPVHAVHPCLDARQFRRPALQGLNGIDGLVDVYLYFGIVQGEGLPVGGGVILEQDGLLGKQGGAQARDGVEAGQTFPAQHGGNAHHLAAL